MTFGGSVIGESSESLFLTFIDSITKEEDPRYGDSIGLLLLQVLVNVLMEAEDNDPSQWRLNMTNKKKMVRRIDNVHKDHTKILPIPSENKYVEDWTHISI